MKCGGGRVVPARSSSSRILLASDKPQHVSTPAPSRRIAHSSPVVKSATPLRALTLLSRRRRVQGHAQDLGTHKADYSPSSFGGTQRKHYFSTTVVGVLSGRQIHRCDADPVCTTAYRARGSSSSASRAGRFFASSLSCADQVMQTQYGFQTIIGDVSGPRLLVNKPEKTLLCDADPVSAVYRPRRSSSAASRAGKLLDSSTCMCRPYMDCPPWVPDE